VLIKSCDIKSNFQKMLTCSTPKSLPSHKSACLMFRSGAMLAGAKRHLGFANEHTSTATMHRINVLLGQVSPAQAPVSGQACSGKASGKLNNHVVRVFTYPRLCQHILR
jgi:hypothetical protein